VPSGFTAAPGKDSGSLLARIGRAARAWYIRISGARAHRATAALIATLPFGAASWTTDARLIAANARFAERLGGDADVLVPGAEYAAVLKRLATGGALNLVREDEENRLVELTREDGATLLIEERPLETGGFVTLVMDITESRRTTQLLTQIRAEQRDLAHRYHEEKLRAEAASQAKSAFLAHLSHDIRTPLNHIIGFADMLAQEPFGPLGDSRYKSYAEAVKSSGERLLGFFSSILDLADFQGARPSLKRDQFTADALLLSQFRRFTSAAQKGGVTLGLGAACELLILGDRFALERMLSNLIDNAIRYTPRGGHVTLNAYRGLKGVVIEVTDTGIGISADRLATLAQPFAFGDSALARDRDTMGLGLAISRAIAEMSGGEISIDSRLGIGTSVTVTLPMAQDSAARAA
jgi:two-component system cell cycle sensor histidine kinase PleC